MTYLMNSANESIEALQSFIYIIPEYPYLWIANCIMQSLAVRAAAGGLLFSRSHPLACYMTTVLYTYSGGILASILLAKPPLAFLNDTPEIALMSVSWYFVFYAPYDCLFKAVKILQLKHVLGLLQEFLAIKHVLLGLEIIYAMYPSSVLYPFVYAIVKSSGSMFIKHIEGVLYDFQPSTGFRVPNRESKTCILATALVILSDSGYLYVSRKMVLAIILFVTLGLRIISIISSNVHHDPYLAFENAVCCILFGSDITGKQLNCSNEFIKREYQCKNKGYDQKVQSSTIMTASTSHEMDSGIILTPSKKKILSQTSGKHNCTPPDSAGDNASLDIAPAWQLRSLRSRKNS